MIFAIKVVISYIVAFQDWHKSSKMGADFYICIYIIHMTDGQAGRQADNNNNNLIEPNQNQVAISSFHSIQIMGTALLAVQVPLALDKKKPLLLSFNFLSPCHPLNSLAFFRNDVVGVGQIRTPNQKTRFCCWRRIGLDSIPSRVYRNKHPPIPPSLTATRVFPPLANRSKGLDL